MSFKHGQFSWGLVYKSPQTTAETLFNEQIQPGHLNHCYEALMDIERVHTGLFNHKKWKLFDVRILIS